jgi:hypothetical protein
MVTTSLIPTTISGTITTSLSTFLTTVISVETVAFSPLRRLIQDPIFCHFVTDSGLTSTELPRNSTISAVPHVQSSTRLSVAAIIGIVLGICVAIASMIIAFLAWKTNGSKKFMSAKSISTKLVSKKKRAALKVVRDKEVRYSGRLHSDNQRN